MFKYIIKKTYKIKAISLIELVMSMVIMSIVIVVFAMGFEMTAKVPAKKNIKLATDLANNYLNEIISKDFPTSLPCPNTPSTATRNNYTNICNYNNLMDYGAKDNLGNQIAGLENFNVHVQVYTSSNDVSLGNLSGSDNIANADLAVIKVTVIHDNIPDLIISTYKGNY